MHLFWHPFLIAPDVRLNVAPASQPYTGPIQSSSSGSGSHDIDINDFDTRNSKVTYPSDKWAPIIRKRYETAVANTWALANHLAVHNDGISDDVNVSTHLWLVSKIDGEKARQNWDMLAYPRYLEDSQQPQVKEVHSGDSTNHIGKKRRNKEEHVQSRRLKVARSGSGKNILRSGKKATPRNQASGLKTAQRTSPLATLSENDLVKLVHKDRSSAASQEALRLVRQRHNVGLTVDLRKDLVTYLFRTPDTQSSEESMQLNISIDIDTASKIATSKPIAAEFHNDKSMTELSKYLRESYPLDESGRTGASLFKKRMPTLSPMGQVDAQKIAGSDQIRMYSFENDIVASNRLAKGMKELIEESIQNFTPLSFVEIRLSESLHHLFEDAPEEIFSQNDLLDWYNAESGNRADAADVAFLPAAGELEHGEESLFLAAVRDLIYDYPDVRKSEINYILSLLHSVNNKDIDLAYTSTEDFKDEHRDFMSSYWQAKEERLLALTGARASAFMMRRWSSNRTSHHVDEYTDVMSRQDALYEVVASRRRMDLTTARQLDEEMEATASLPDAVRSKGLAPTVNALFNADTDMFALASRILAMRDEFLTHLRDEHGIPISYADLSEFQQALVCLYQTATGMVMGFVNSRTFSPFAPRWALKDGEIDPDFHQILEDLLPPSNQVKHSGTWAPPLDEESYPTKYHTIQDSEIVSNEELMREAMREVTGWLRPSEV